MQWEVMLWMFCSSCRKFLFEIHKIAKMEMEQQQHQSRRHGKNQRAGSTRRSRRRRGPGLQQREVEQAVHAPLLPEKLDTLCKICEGEGMVLHTLRCGHSFCRTCIERYVRMSLELEVIVCPEVECNQVLRPNDFSQAEFPELAYEMHSTSYLAHARVKKFCKECSTPLVVPLDMVKKSNFSILQCENPICSRSSGKPSSEYICYYCDEVLSSWFIGLHSCVHFCSGEGRALQKSIPWSERNLTRHCPKCFMVVIKNGGCPNMSCGTCRHSFCWRCLGPQNHFTTSGLCHGPESQPSLQGSISDRFLKVLEIVCVPPLSMIGAIVIESYLLCRNAWKAVKKARKWYWEKAAEERELQRQNHHALAAARISNEQIPLIVTYELKGDHDSSLMEWATFEQLLPGMSLKKSGYRNFPITLNFVNPGPPSTDPRDPNSNLGIVLPQTLQRRGGSGWRTLSLDQILDTYTLIHQESVFYLLSLIDTGSDNFLITPDLLWRANRIAETYIRSAYPDDQEQLALNGLEWGTLLECEFAPQLKRRIGLIIQEQSPGKDAWFQA